MYNRGGEAPGKVDHDELDTRYYFCVQEKLDKVKWGLGFECPVTAFIWNIRHSVQSEIRRRALNNLRVLTMRLGVTQDICGVNFVPLGHLGVARVHCSTLPGGRSTSKRQGKRDSPAAAIR